MEFIQQINWILDLRQPTIELRGFQQILDINLLIRLPVLVIYLGVATVFFELYAIAT